MQRLGAAALLALLAGGALALGSVQVWTPSPWDDPAYASGRPSVCPRPEAPGSPVPARVQDGGEAPWRRGLARTWTHAFDAAAFRTGTLALCSEYGTIEAVGVEGTQALLRVTLASPFPGGDRAVRDTLLSTALRAEGDHLTVAVGQRTQGFTGYVALAGRGARAALLDIALELPKAIAWDLQVHANHQRAAVRGLDVRGAIHGHASPGVDLDVGLAGPLAVAVYGGDVQTDLAGDGRPRAGGSALRLRPLASTSIQYQADLGAVTMDIQAPAGIDATANTTGPIRFDLGPGARIAGGHARSADYEAQPLQLRVLAQTLDGPVAIRRVDP